MLCVALALKKLLLEEFCDKNHHVTFFIVVTIGFSGLWKCTLKKVYKSFFKRVYATKIANKRTINLITSNTVNTIFSMDEKYLSHKNCVCCRNLRICTLDTDRSISGICEITWNYSHKLTINFPYSNKIIETMLRQHGMLNAYSERKHFGQRKRIKIQKNKKTNM